MKIAGYIAIAVGLIFAISALFMDVSVDVGNGYRVNNLGLMASKQNYIIFGGMLAIAGVIAAVFGDKHKAASKDAIMEESEDGGDDSSRLSGVNVKVILGLVVTVFAVIIGIIVAYRH